GYEPWHAEMHSREIDRVVATRQPLRGEVHFNGTHGKRLYDYIFVPVIGADGSVEAVAGTTRDVTELRTQEEAIKKNEERQRLALAASHDFGIWDWDVVNDVFTADERFGALFSLSPEEARQGVKLAHVLPVIHPEDLPRVTAHVDRVLKTGGRYVEEYRVILKDGTVRWVSVRGEVQLDEQGRAVRFPGVGIDITAEREATRALKESEERWRNLSNAMPQLVWTANAADGSAQYFNSRWEQYTGHTAEELQGDAWLECLHPEDHERVMHAWQRAVNDEGEYNLEYRIRRHDGIYRWFKTRGVPIRDSAGRIVIWYGTCTDIQENVEAREQAEAANIAKTEFLANMSHEIRTPMNAVIGLANILALSQPLTARQQEFIHTLQLSADSLLALINDLLDISKIEARTVELEKIPFSLAQLMQEIISIMSVRAGEKNLTFTSHAPCIKGQTYLGDPTRLRQIIMNLCSNAIKFTESGSIAINVECHDTDEMGLENVTITVEDSGIGIAQDKLVTIFHKFVQADTSINRKYGGTGLGLAITKTLVEIMGGHIGVTSTPGVGSCFTVTIPLRHAETQLHEGAVCMAMEEESHALTRPLVLLVEDYAPNVLVATSFLEQFGYRSHTAMNGREAIEKIRANPYALVLMDVQMHGMNGLEATSLIREYEKRHNLPRLPIIGMTAHALSGDRERCLGAGMDDYIAKPFNPEELKEKIAALLVAA
ncbi:MAG: PAS domain-containing protein, partial [Rickettsiales bacterium]|nr:PAS domain-containing protein [Rickettsiales bacterium]